MVASGDDPGVGGTCNRRLQRNGASHSSLHARDYLGSHAQPPSWLAEDGTLPRHLPPIRGRERYGCELTMLAAAHPAPLTQLRTVDAAKRKETACCASVRRARVATGVILETADVAVISKSTCPMENLRASRYAHIVAIGELLVQALRAEPCKRSSSSDNYILKGHACFIKSNWYMSNVPPGYTCARSGRPFCLNGYPQPVTPRAARHHCPRDPSLRCSDQPLQATTAIDRPAPPAS